MNYQKIMSFQTTFNNISRLANHANKPIGLRAIKGKDIISNVILLPYIAYLHQS